MISSSSMTFALCVLSLTLTNKIWVLFIKAGE